MNTARALFVVPVAVVALSGCTTEVGDEAVGTAESAALSGNALSGNALSGNALSGNALSGNALSGNALSGNALTAIQDPSASGDLNRQFLKYTVGCAFTPAQSFGFTWTDSTGTVHNEVYYGELGLAPTWSIQPLDDVGQHLVTACLGARTNYYGVHVSISLRDDVDILTTTKDELSTYAYVEGAFWGNIFGSTPYVRSCYTSANVAHSRSDYRECAAGHVNTDGTISECPSIHIVGACTDVCKKLSKNGGYYTKCGDPSLPTDDDTQYFLTVGLQ
jgi:hypothetical protein